jgi:hypothetical protein
MKDLLALVADADAEAVFKAILFRHQSMGIRPITFDVKRCPNHDSGVVKDGASLARFNKEQYAKVILALDYHGSGREGKGSAEECRELVQGELEKVTWSGNSAVLVLQPELEEWLWRNQSSLAAYLGQSKEWLEAAIERYSQKQRIRPTEILALNPKEVWEHVMKRELKRTISPADFRKIAEKAGLKAWYDSPSFAQLVSQLQNWFPPEHH